MSAKSSSIWIISGEASGDNYGASLALELKAQSPSLILGGMGGEKMRQAGVDTIVDSQDLGVVGIFEVLRHLPVFIKIYRYLVKEAARVKPSAVILIDYPGMNMRLAAAFHKLQIPVFYYISPQVWAWKKGRIPKLAATVNKMLCIFPFEPAVYQGSGLDAEFVGHPLLKTLQEFRLPEDKREKDTILLLPGSRSAELKRLLPLLFETAEMLHKQKPELKFEISLANEKSLKLAETLLSNYKNKQALPEMNFSFGKTRELMGKATAGIAASGTVTMEATVLDLPLVVIYKVNWISWIIGKILVKLPFIAITNLIAEKEVFEEYLQKDAKAQNLTNALLKILPDGQRYKEIKNDMKEAVAKLGEDKDVHKIVANIVLKGIRD